MNTPQNIELQIKEKEQALTSMRSYHMSLWNDYGSELCAGDMVKQERKLQEEIDELKKQL